MAAESIRLGLLKGIRKVEEFYSLQELNPLRAGGLADYFCEVASTVELASAIKAATDLEIPYLVVGRGKGILFSDGGFPGLVIHNHAESSAFAADKSQAVVDSGMSLQRFITLAAGQGFGGLDHLYADTGTVGGALYCNTSAADPDGQTILSSVRYATMLMPPTRMEHEATISRYKAEWFKKSEAETRLKWLKNSQPLGTAQPVILTVMFQLTRVRTDELLLRLKAQTKEIERTQPKGDRFGPLFMNPPGAKVTELLTGAGVASLRVGEVYVDRYFPNYLASRAPANSSQAIQELITQIIAQVEKTYAITLEPQYEYLGVW